MLHDGFDTEQVAEHARGAMTSRSLVVPTMLIRLLEADADLSAHARS